MLRNASGQLLDMEARVTSERTQEEQIIADYWKRAGANATLFTVPRALTNDPEYRTSFPAVGLSSHSYNRDFLGTVNVTTEQAATVQNRWTGKNRGTYSNPELDRLYATYLSTIDPSRRDDLAVDIERIFSSDVAQGLLFYIPQVAAVRTGLSGIKPPIRGGYAWNIWEWEWK
jgi:ABC-type transport system substrate-binding protein